MSHFLRPIFALSLAAFMVAGASLSLDAAPAGSANFDGLWSVVIVTLQGSCDGSYRYPCASRGAASCRPMPTRAIACTVL